MTDINKEIKTTVKTGKVLFGVRNAINNAKNGKAKLIIISSNCPQKFLEDIQNYCNFSKISMFIYNGSSIDSGSVCGKPFTVSALTIKDQGDSDILKLMEATNV